ncbi:GGDEF domain-containing protein [Cereibacter changlensis]|nr:sensor domain-containing diguanylate cyclase [Cereibacter changlensis]PZX48269.1 diguanylate cyclase (GGDEF)-like protein [Cereibacter changlensis]
MSTPDLVALYDRDDHLQTANPAYCEAFHCDPAGHPVWADLMRANFENRRGPIIVTDDIEEWLVAAGARRRSAPYRSSEAALHDGRWLWVTETVSPEGQLLLHACDITSLHEDSRPLRQGPETVRRASWTDNLSKVPNRRYVMERLERWVAAQRKLPDPGHHALAIMDLDSFKAINETFGIEYGASILTSFCRDVISLIRPLDLFGRIGGEQFLLLLPNCTLRIAQDRLDQLQRKLGRHAVDEDHSQMRYSFSAGLVAVNLDEDIHETLRLADKMLNAAKSNGPGHVQLCGSTAVRKGLGIPTRP